MGRIGRGGMGLVYLGETGTGVQVAIKVVRPEYAQDPEFRTRFRREAAAAQRVRSRYTAALVDADLDGPAPWLATEYVPGPTLAAQVADVGPLAEVQVRQLVEHLAGALHDVHRADLVHRDIKPANVLLGPDGPRLIDMGIARAADSTSLTMTGMQLGTPVFMAPEQARVDEPSAATDVWALGAVAFFAATGRRPFGEGRPDIMYYRVVHEEPRLDECPDFLRPFVETCLAKEPADRPTVPEILAAHPHLPGPRPSPGTVRHADVPFVAPEPVDDSPTDDTQVPRAPAPEPTPEPAEAAPRRRGRPVLVAAAAGILVLGAGAALAMSWPLVGGTPTTSPSTTPSTSPSPSATPAATDLATGATIDPCLVGRWEQTSMTDTWDLLGEDVGISGWDGRVLEIHDDGSQVITYDDADPVTGAMSVGTITDTWSGTTTDQLATDDGTLEFTATDHSAVTVDRDVAGFTETYRPPSGTADGVLYTCDGTTLTQREPDGAYEATFTRLD
nr:serine/threonine-protein kinase [Isoptericola halotolerans]